MFPTASREGIGWHRLSLLLGGLLVVYYAVPLVALVGRTSPATLSATVADPAVRGAAATSVLASLSSTAVAGVFGVPLAYWLARTGGRLGRVLLVLVVVPLVLPPVVSGMLLVATVGAGPVASLGLTRSFAGVVLAQTFVASPLVVVTARAAFREVDEDLLEAATTMGCTPWRAFRRISLPLARPGILAGLALAFARAMGEFGATLVLAYYPRTLPVQVWVSFTSGGVDAAFPVALVLVVVSLASLGVALALGAVPGR